jgi:hypothetical protein
MRRVRCGAWLGGVVLAGGLAAAAQAADPDYSDLWWNAAESGWGMQLVRGGDVMFATLYVYDASARPTFFTATLSNSGSAWSGTLYETTGPFYAAPAFDPAHVVLRIAGTLEFTPATLTSAHVQYAVDGAAVAKDVTRQTLRLINFSGTYPVTTQRITTHCPDAAANGDRVAQETLAIAHDGDVIAVDWTSAQRTCRYTGAYMQSGRLGAAQSSYSCSDGESGDFAFFELTRQDGFVAGRFQGHGVSNGCDYRGRFSGFLPD